MSPYFLLTSRYQQCLRGRCRLVGDAETEFSFDQPEPLFLDSDGGRVRSSLVKTGLGTSYDKDREEEENYAIDNNIHMIWVGSRLPDKYVRGPGTTTRILYYIKGWGKKNLLFQKL